MKVKVIVTLKNGVLDPQGKAILQTLNGMSFSNILFIAKKYFQQFCEIYREKTKKSWNLIF